MHSSRVGRWHTSWQALPGTANIPPPLPSSRSPHQPSPAPYSPSASRSASHESMSTATGGDLFGSVHERERWSCATPGFHPLTASPFHSFTRSWHPLGASYDPRGVTEKEVLQVLSTAPSSTQCSTLSCEPRCAWMHQLHSSTPGIAKLHAAPARSSASAAQATGQRQQSTPWRCKS